MACASPFDLLIAARECFDSGDLIGAGVRLREALRLQLRAMCEMEDCVPGSHRRRGPAHLAWALRGAGVLSSNDHRSVRGMIRIGNAAAHSQPLDSDALGGAIRIAFHLLDRQFNEEASGEALRVFSECDFGDGQEGGAV